MVIVSVKERDSLFFKLKQEIEIMITKHDKPMSHYNHIARICEIFPHCVTEAKNAQGAIKLAVDFDLLKQELSGQIVEGSQERYQLNWPGKQVYFVDGDAHARRYVLSSATTASPPTPWRSTWKQIFEQLSASTEFRSI